MSHTHERLRFFLRFDSFNYDKQIEVTRSLRRRSVLGRQRSYCTRTVPSEYSSALRFHRRHASMALGEIDDGKRAARATLDPLRFAKFHIETMPRQRNGPYKELAPCTWSDRAKSRQGQRGLDHLGGRSGEDSFNASPCIRAFLIEATPVLLLSQPCTEI